MDSNLLSARLIALSMTLGVIFLWVVGWVVTGGGTEGLASGGELSPGLLFLIWAALAVPGFGAALVFRGRAMAALSGEAGGGGTGASGDPTSVAQTHLIIAWALLEGPALFSGVFYLLTAEGQFVLAGALVFLVGMAISFPRREWYEEAVPSSVG